MTEIHNGNPLDFFDIQKSLIQQSYAPVPFPLGSPVFEEAIQAFFKFLEEPDPIKNHIHFSIAPLHRRGEVGFVRRDPNDHVYNDSKDFFHYHPAIFEKYGAFLTSHPVVNDFIQKAKPIWDAAYQTVKQVLQTFEPNFPGIGDRIFDAHHPHFLLRFLKYNWQESGELLAKPHFDAGSFTLAIAESCAGLRIGSTPDTLREVEHKPGQALFMLSSNFKKVMDTDALSAGWHDVVQVDKTLIGKPFARWAIVAFIEAHGVEALSRDETHKWYKVA